MLARACLRKVLAQVLARVACASCWRKILLDILAWQCKVLARALREPCACTRFGETRSSDSETFACASCLRRGLREFLAQVPCASNLALRKVLAQVLARGRLLIIFIIYIVLHITYYILHTTYYRLHITWRADVSVASFTAIKGWRTKCISNRTTWRFDGFWKIVFGVLCVFVCVCVFVFVVAFVSVFVSVRFS